MVGVFVRSYLASGAHAHAWLLPLIRDWNSAVLFPGFLSIGLGVWRARSLAWRTSAPHDARLARAIGKRRCCTARSRVLTFWASLGPRAGLYTVLYYAVPVFSFLRAPERMGIVVMLCLAGPLGLRRAGAAAPIVPSREAHRRGRVCRPRCSS